MIITATLIYTPETRADCLSIRCQLCTYSLNNEQCPLPQWRKENAEQSKGKPDNFKRAIKTDPEKPKDYRIFGR